MKRTKEQQINILEWADALESGRNKQGFRAFGGGGTYCMLGLGEQVMNAQRQAGDLRSLRRHRASITGAVYREASIGMPDPMKHHFGIGWWKLTWYLVLNDFFQVGFKRFAKKLRKKTSPEVRMEFYNGKRREEDPEARPRPVQRQPQPPQEQAEEGVEEPVHGDRRVATPV